MAEITFISQRAPLDEYGRALYAVVRSIVRALVDQLGADDFADLGCDRSTITFRQLAKVARLERDKGMRGDGFEWAVHEAIVGAEPRVVELVSAAMRRASRHMKKIERPTSLLFGAERSRHLGFLDAVIENTHENAVVLPDGRGRPFAFGTWVPIAAKGAAAEAELDARIKRIWKTDLFLGDEDRLRHAAATVKSNWAQIETGAGLRIGIVPEAPDLPAGTKSHPKFDLELAVLPDPSGFMGLFNDAYAAVAEAVCVVGKHVRPPYYLGPSATAQRVQAQLERYATAKVEDIEYELDRAAQQDLVGVNRTLLSVDPPHWLHLKESTATEKVVAPRPLFEKLD